MVEYSKGTRLTDTISIRIDYSIHCKSIKGILRDHNMISMTGAKQKKKIVHDLKN